MANKFKVGDRVIGRDDWGYRHEGIDERGVKQIGTITSTRSGDRDSYFKNVVKWPNGNNSNAGDMCLEFAPLVYNGREAYFSNIMPVGGDKYELNSVPVIVFGP
jgi:hypothetical protein